MSQFSHLHVHTQYSLLDGAAEIGKLYQKALADEMPALAITDHGNMFGVFKFVAEAYNAKKGLLNDDGTPKVKPIIGCEFYVVEDRHIRQFTKEKKDKRYHQLFLAKNAEGYQNITKLCSLGFIDGLYGKYPRIDKELILKHHKGLIATTCCIGASVPRTILDKGEAEGEIEFKWWLDLFGEDFYIELQRHDIPDQDKVNEVLVRWAEKYNVKIICSNDSHYVDQADANAHDILLCVNTGDKQSTPKATDEEGGKGYRFGFPSDKFYFKTTAEMKQLFKDLPQSIDNTNEIVGKIEHLKLKKDILLPHFQCPLEYATQDDYLYHLTYTGAKERYETITAEIEERLNFELLTIRTMGFAGYFLIVSDFIKAGRDLGVFIGPGRGSAAGSAVAYCIGITNIDPIKYNLLFERFLNPDRKSMPDIDTDFDDEGRQKVIDYVVEKYGKNQVAQIITYGTMAAKSSIKDVARVMDLPLNQSNALAKLVPDKPGTELNKIIHGALDGEKGLSKDYPPEDMENIKKLRELYAGKDDIANILRDAVKLEGSVRSTGIHAAGIIIAPKDLYEILPVCTSKETELLITQYDGGIIEDAGVIKMDFLGLKTLTILRDALRLIETNHGVKISIDDIPLDDAKTFDLYQKGSTNATFQFESPGMQKYLKELKPDAFADLIAMNALYRPGPIAYIPNFIKRKHGLEPIAYDLPEMEEYLADTYGITVYQEQVMLLSQKLAGFSKGDADVLRKAMGKKDRATLDKMKGKFMDGATEKGLAKDKLEKVWTDWEAFAQYAFNKSHSTCYAFVAYQTAYLKAHYPSEFMAAVLSNNISNLAKITFFMQECRNMGLSVLGPDINESQQLFAVNAKGEIRFGLSAIKGLGEKAVNDIITERTEGGVFRSPFDICKRVDLKSVSKKALECLTESGAFDTFGYNRATYFYSKPDERMVLLEKLIKYGTDHQNNKHVQQNSLFGGGEANQDILEPTIPTCDEWDLKTKLKKEYDAVGLYFSGHPMDDYTVATTMFADTTLAEITDEMYKLELDKHIGKIVKIACIVKNVDARISAQGSAYAFFKIEDYDSSFDLAMFKGYDKLRHNIFNDAAILITGKVQRSRRNQDEPDLMIDNVQSLDELLHERAKALRLSLDINNINADTTAKIKQLAKKYRGSTPLSIMITDHAKKIQLNTIATDYSVSLGKPLFDELNSLLIGYNIVSRN